MIEAAKILADSPAQTVYKTAKETTETYAKLADILTDALPPTVTAPEPLPSRA